jgi:hypothetical protein
MLRRQKTQDLWLASEIAADVSINSTFNSRLRLRDSLATPGIVAHESVHVAQNLFEAMGETNPGCETEAYIVQFIVDWVHAELGKLNKTDP